MNMQLNDLNDDDKFESFLREFRPRRPRPLTIDGLEPGRSRRFVLRAWAGAAAAIVVAAILLFIAKHGQKQPGTPDTARNSAPVELTSPEPLTIASANALLAQAPSVKAAVDQMAFSPQSAQVPEGKHSALAVLSEEKIKL
jgi:hypothetical protein